MLATLNVHESMSQKVVQEAAAPLVLPELRTMSKSPRQFPLYIRKLPLSFRVVLNINQFARFMRFVSYTYLCAIANDVMTYLQHDQNLGERVEREHGQYLRNSQRIEDWSSGFDVHGSSNSVPKLGETVDFENLIAGPAMALTSSSGLEASTTTGVNGVAKSTSWEDGVCGRILDGSDVSVSWTQRTLTDASTSQLQVRSPTPGSVRPSLSFPVTAAHSLLSRLKPRPAPLRPVGSILLNTQAIAPPPRQVGPIPLRYILIPNPPSQTERLHPRWPPHFHRFHRICVLESHQHLKLSRCQWVLPPSHRIYHCRPRNQTIMWHSHRRVFP